MEFDCRLDFLGAQSLLLAVDHELACLPHDLLEKLDYDAIDDSHALLRYAHFGLCLLQHSEDVSLEGALVTEGDLLLHHLLGLSVDHSRACDIEVRVLRRTA